MANNKKPHSNALKAKRLSTGSQNQIKNTGLHWLTLRTKHTGQNAEKLRHSIINALLYTIPGLFKFDDWSKDYE